MTSARALLAAARGRVRARLERATRLPLTVVTAPAGYGRATVVREFLEVSGLAYRRVDVDLSDGDILVLVRAFARAVTDISPALASTFVSVCDRIGSSPDAADQLAAWIAQYIEPAAVTFVVNITGAPSDDRIFALLRSLIDRTHDPVRWIVVLESAALLPVARWLAEGRMEFPIAQPDLEVMRDDLVRAGELIAFPAPGERLSQLWHLTGAWPAAIALAVAAGAALDSGRRAARRYDAVFLSRPDAALDAFRARKRPHRKHLYVQSVR